MAKLIYIHQRGISLTVGHQGHSVLIHDYFATKVCKVVTIDLDPGGVREIDSAAVREYARSANPNSRLIIVPDAQSFHQTTGRC